MLSHVTTRFALKRTKGFTLIEVLVAISVLTTILFVPLSVVAQYLTQTALTEHAFKAEVKTQEVLEYVRYTRDSSLLGLDSGDWFTVLRSPTHGVNPYASCFTDRSTWVTQSHLGADSLTGSAVALTPYCIVQCRAEDGTLNACNGENGLVAAVAQGASERRVRSNVNARTCDGEHPKANNAFTVTLSIVTSDDAESGAQYAIIRPCVSFADLRGEVQRVILEETLFEWVIRE